MKLAIVPMIVAALAANAADHWRSVADKLIQSPAEKWAFNWGEGVQMIGLMKIHQATGDRPARNRNISIRRSRSPGSSGAAPSARPMADLGIG